MFCTKFILDVLWSQEYFVGYACAHVPVHGHGIYNESIGCISPSVVPTSVVHWETLNDCLNTKYLLKEDGWSASYLVNLKAFSWLIVMQMLAPLCRGTRSGLLHWTLNNF